ncbi:MAG TPA: glucose-6-phosphate isomerase [Candidatus Aquilonibacter sp.]|nr:glucose-6-phosphate isomerase [Candidatus Aquilonibacter sp.]
MNYSKLQWWERFQKYYTEFPEIGLAVDLSRMNVDDAFFAAMEPKIQKALADMDALEAGAIANPDENRMVGHYWLRNPALAPTPEIRKEIQDAIDQVNIFAAKVHAGEIRGAGGPFENYLLIGIGGSALGPQFVAHALGDPRTDKLKPHFFDNTDPDGMDRVLATIGGGLNRTLCIIISKSGGTKETRNGMLVAKTAFERASLDFGRHSVAVTSAGSELDKYAIQNKWLERFPMWDWVGGRTSELSPVGLLPAALQGINISDLIKGAYECDKVTRTKNAKTNPACQLALTWFASGNGKGTKNMVILPYKDRLELFSKYLQQLVMESLGKERDLSGNIVNQGITVLGNKGATDQHSYIQQLRDGLNDFFVTFIEVLNDGHGSNLAVEPNVASGDFLEGFYLGTRQALAEKSRESITITIENTSAFSAGILIALFERAVGLYATFVNINAYHQPGVEAGKKAAANIIQLQNKILRLLSQSEKQALAVFEIAKGIDSNEEVESVFKICEHLSANNKIQKSIGSVPFDSRYASS